jgi:hypothetical protein
MVIGIRNIVARYVNKDWPVIIANIPERQHVMVEASQIRMVIVGVTLDGTEMKIINVNIIKKHVKIQLGIVMIEHLDVILFGLLVYVINGTINSGKILI